MPPYRNPVEARRKKERPVQKVADENCYMSAADFNAKYHNTDQRQLRDGAAGSRARGIRDEAEHEASVGSSAVMRRPCRCAL
jgi:hypothetical protein